MFNAINSINIKKDEYCYAMLTTDEDYIICTIINAKTEKILIRLPFRPDDTFIKKIYFDNQKYKAVIVDIFLLNSRQLCIDLREKLNKLKIPNYFISNENFISSSLLISANVNIKFDETILAVITKPDKIFALEYRFTPEGYDRIRKDIIKLTEEKDPQKIRETIMETSNAKKILVLQDSASKISIKTILKSKKLVIFNSCISEYQDKFIIETCKWLFDKSYIKYFVLPIYDRYFLVSGSYYQEKEKNQKETLIMSSKHDEKLPFAMSEMFEKTYCSCWINFIPDKDECHKLELKKNCHRYKFTINVDTEGFETYEIEEIVLEEIQNLPKQLDSKMKTKIPVIGFFDNSSVVCINKDGNYQFSDNCNGSIGMDNFISFNKKKPKYGNAAINALRKKLSFVVFDLFTILAMPKDDIQISETWGFKITSNAEHPILIEYDDFNNPGKRTAASPAFLMALLIKKQYFKAIKSETGGESPKEIGIWIYDQYADMNEDHINRAKKGLENACELLKIKCCFVEC